jgi:hypothetical protein
MEDFTGLIDEDYTFWASVFFGNFRRIIFRPFVTILLQWAEETVEKYLGRIDRI